MVTLRDANGQYHAFDRTDLTIQLTEHGFTVFGLSLDVIAEMRRILLERHAPLQPTPEDVRRLLDGS